MPPTAPIPDTSASRIAVLALGVSNDHGEVMLASPTFEACARYIADKSVGYGWAEAAKCADNFQRTIGWRSDDLVFRAMALIAERRSA